MITLKDIRTLTREERIKLTEYMGTLDSLTSAGKPSLERTMLIFILQANEFKDLATDDVVDEKADANYESLAIENWEGYLEYKALLG